MSLEQTKQKLDKEQVRRALKKVFPMIKSRSDLRPLSHDECLHLRSRIATLSDKDLPFYVPQILEDLIDTHTGQLGNSEDAEAVVQHLNILVQGTDLETIRKMYGEEGLSKALEDESFIRQSKKKSFAAFTKEQANAICQWLEHVRHWPELKWYSLEIDAAIAYWKNRK